MLTPKGIYAQITRLTTDLIESSLCDAQNFPSITDLSENTTEIGITHSDNSIFLKSIPYAEMYQEVLKRNAYNIKMIDGALLTLLYRFKNNEIVAHRLSYFPAPDLVAFQNEPEMYMEDEIYLDVLDKRIVTVPLRFDYDNDEKTYQPIEHPISHLTLGQYENCRIPVSSALTPYQFITFITINFYHTAHSKSRLRIYKEKFKDSIFPEEREFLHINAPIYRN